VQCIPLLLKFEILESFEVYPNVNLATKRRRESRNVKTFVDYVKIMDYRCEKGSFSFSVFPR
jgi:hypothetical protein